MADENRDLLIEIRSDMKHVREDLSYLKASDARQGEKLEALATKTEGHDKTLGFVVKGFWMLIAGGGSLILWLIQSKP